MFVTLGAGFRPALQRPAGVLMARRSQEPVASEAAGSSRRSRRSRSSASASSAACHKQLPLEFDNDAAVAGILPPWTVERAKASRHQPTTLQFHLHRFPADIREIQESLDMRRYQPTSADMGLDFRLNRTPQGDASQRGVKPVGFGALDRTGELPRHTAMATQSAGKVPPKTYQFKQPTWWGQAGGGGSDPHRPTYEDHGNWYGPEASRDGLAGHLRSESLPLLHNRYSHQNPFMAQFARRGPGGVIACDVSVTPKP